MNEAPSAFYSPFQHARDSVARSDFNRKPVPGGLLGNDLPLRFRRRVRAKRGRQASIFDRPILDDRSRCSCEEVRRCQESTEGFSHPLKHLRSINRSQKGRMRLRPIHEQHETTLIGENFTFPTKVLHGLAVNSSLKTRVHKFSQVWRSRSRAAPREEPGHHWVVSQVALWDQFSPFERTRHDD